MKMEDITEEIKKKIEFEKRGVGLEDGDFYDGSCFRDNCGIVLRCHPSLIFLRKNFYKLFKIIRIGHICPRILGRKEQRNREEKRTNREGIQND